MASEDTRKETELLKEELATLRKDMAELVGTLKDMGKHRASDVKDKAQQELDHRLEQLSQAYQAAKSQGGRACDTMCHTIEDRPLASIAVAFAAGLVLSKILSVPER